ncbi:hypothetical protein H0H92_004735 [Tricholoma furcatifolium]|nr:hypothetical protein H0H92_004735 [Tricholoma furcatifolium]
MVEYSLDVDIPTYVWEHPVIIGMSQATSDIMTWPNKEQADGDYQNLVCVLQHAHDLDLQEAVDMLTKMIENRVQDYLKLKESMPSFGPDVDPAVQKYIYALEQFVQGCVVWYYSSPRYFFDIDPLGKPEVVIYLRPKAHTITSSSIAGSTLQGTMVGSLRNIFYAKMRQWFLRETLIG